MSVENNASFCYRQYPNKHLIIRKLHLCDVCRKCFSSNSDLRQHMLTHTKEKPFQCNVCYNIFGRIDHCSRPMKRQGEKKT